MAKIYTLVNQKGGVGKTTSAINIGAYLGYYGQKVLIVDLDPQANATSSLGIDKLNVKNGTYEVLIGSAPIAPAVLHNPRLKLSILPSSPALAGAEVELLEMPHRELRLKEALEPIIERYDYILIDCPPSLSTPHRQRPDGRARRGAHPGPVRIPGAGGDRAADADHQTRARVRFSLNLKVRGVIMTMYDGRTKLASDVVSEVQQILPDAGFSDHCPAQHPAG